MRTAVLLIGIAAGLILGFIRLADAGALSPTVCCLSWSRSA